MAEGHTTVEYREIPGYVGYRAGTDGSIWSRRHSHGKGRLRPDWRQLRPIADNQGWFFVTLRHEGKSLIRYVHRLVLETFVGPCPPGLMCRHFPDPNPANNSITNIQWGTQQENADDAILHGATARGTRLPQAKLYDDKVRAIRAKYVPGVYGQKRLAKEFGVECSTIQSILHRRSWTHVA